LYEYENWTYLFPGVPVRAVLTGCVAQEKEEQPPSVIVHPWATRAALAVADAEPQVYWLPPKLGRRSALYAALAAFHPTSVEL